MSTMLYHFHSTSHQLLPWLLHTTLFLFWNRPPQYVPLADFKLRHRTASIPSQEETKLCCIWEETSYTFFSETITRAQNRRNCCQYCQSHFGEWYTASSVAPLFPRPRLALRPWRTLLAHWVLVSLCGLKKCAEMKLGYFCQARFWAALASTFLSEVIWSRLGKDNCHSEEWNSPTERWDAKASHQHWVACWKM